MNASRIWLLKHLHPEVGAKHRHTPTCSLRGRRGEEEEEWGKQGQEGARQTEKKRRNIPQSCSFFYVSIVAGMWGCGGCRCVLCLCVRRRAESHAWCVLEAELTALCIRLQLREKLSRPPPPTHTQQFDIRIKANSIDINIYIYIYIYKTNILKCF